MSTEQIFRRFQELMKEKHGIPEQDITKVWNKTSFCSHILASGKNKDTECGKRCVKDQFYCKSHLKK